MYYKYKGAKINISSDEIPKGNKILQRFITIFFGIGAVISLIGSRTYPVMILVAGGYVGFIFLFRWIFKRSEKTYYSLRNELMKLIEDGDIKIVDESTYKGVLFRDLEIGTNLTEWKKGIETSAGYGLASVKFSFTNLTGKTIKYLTVSMRPYNAVGDVVECTIKNISLSVVKCTGPYEAGATYTLVNENAWVNPTIEKVKIESVEIEYMDGSAESITAENIAIMHTQKGLSDTESRESTKAIGTLLMIVSGIIDVLSIVCISSLGSAATIITAISTITFFIGLKMRY